MEYREVIIVDGLYNSCNVVPDLKRVFHEKG
jgi:hypothetical protein